MTTITSYIRAVCRDAIMTGRETQVSLSQKTGISQPTISEFLAGHRDMTGERLTRLARAVGLKKIPLT